MKAGNCYLSKLLIEAATLNQVGKLHKNWGDILATLPFDKRSLHNDRTKERWEKRRPANWDKLQGVLVAVPDGESL